MKCPDCNGTGKDYNWLPVERCKTCGGIGLINMTNEEWFDRLSTEEKAEWFAKKSKEIIDDFANFDFKSNCKDYWMAWLKEVHEA